MMERRQTAFAALAGCGKRGFRNLLPRFYLSPRESRLRKEASLMPGAESEFHRNPLRDWFFSPLLIALIAAGCFHPAVAKPEAAPPKDSIGAPYDLVWDAALEVIKKNELRVQAQDPVHGILEAQGRHFTLQDADCGLVATPFGKAANEPTDEATTVYNFYLKPDGPEATKVSIQATFSSPGNAPFHPVRDLGCVSKGRQERRLFKEIKEAAAAEHRPVFKPPEPP
jgi:hypothetical protein